MVHIADVQPTERFSNHPRSVALSPQLPCTFQSQVHYSSRPYGIASLVCWFCTARRAIQGHNHGWYVSNLIYQTATPGLVFAGNLHAELNKYSGSLAISQRVVDTEYLINMNNWTHLSSIRQVIRCWMDIGLHSWIYSTTIYSQGRRQVAKNLHLANLARLQDQSPLIFAYGAGWGVSGWHAYGANSRYALCGCLLKNWVCTIQGPRNV